MGAETLFQLGSFFETVGWGETCIFPCCMNSQYFYSDGILPSPRDWVKHYDSFSFSNPNRHGIISSRAANGGYFMCIDFAAPAA